MSPPPDLRVRVARRWNEAQDIDAFELVAADGAPLPQFEAGAHVELDLAPGLVRPYSLCNDPAERHRYLIGVLRTVGSRGGSAAVHERLLPGTELQISPPRNRFPLAADAARHLLLAGGIGVTPLLAMARHLARAGAEFQLHYLARSRARAAFLGALAAPELARHSAVHLDDDPHTAFELRRCLSAQPDGTHLYACGPAGFMAHVLEVAGHEGWPAAQLHHESFGAADPAPADDGPAFDIELARSGRIVAVPAGNTALAALRQAGVELPSSCESGVCGTCWTRVVRGTPLHRDTYLTDAEKAAGDAFLPCCSRAPGGSRLVIDA